MASETASLHPIDRVTKFLIFLRVILVFLPQYGYIHPDEFFQSTEITAGDVLKTDSYRPWEFTTDNPIRCCVFVHLFAYLPFKLLTYVGSSAYLRLVLPRLVASLLSLVVDYVVYRIRGGHAVKVVASSYLAMAYFTRTFSNVTETVLFALLILLSFPVSRVFYKDKDEAKNTPDTATLDGEKVEEETPSAAGEKKTESDVVQKEKAVNEAPPKKKVEFAEGENAKASDKNKEPAIAKRPIQRIVPQFHSCSSEFLYVTVIVCGIFNRPTFVCFALTPFMFRFYSTNVFKNFVLACIRMSIYAVLLSSLFIAADSVYYSGLDEFLADPKANLVITPLNFLLYNSNSENLANHGLHERWLHFLINIPLLFGLHSMYVYQDIYRLILKRENFNIEKFSLHMCTFVPLLGLSVFPHQEPRFLLPLLIPFALRNALKLTQSDRFCGMWYAFNIYMFLFFALAHQAGVVPMQMNSYENGKVVYFHTYMPPRHLTPDGVNREIIDLKEASISVLEHTFQKHREGFLVYPAGVHSTVTTAMALAYCTPSDEMSHYPHVATEYIPAVLQKCGFNLQCLLSDSLGLRKLKFHCESTL